MHDNEIETYSKCLLITSQTVNLLLLLLFAVTGSLGRLTEVPKNNFVLSGATAEFTCCSNVKEPLFWKVMYISSLSFDYIFDSGLVNGFRNNSRFNVTDGSRSGCYRLIIADIRVDDAGTYYCVDHQGLGQHKEWELVIVESLDCQEKNHKAEYMGENKFGLPEDVYSTVCIARYFGNISPKPICAWASGTQIFVNHQHFTETTVTTILTIQMPVKKIFNKDQLFCYLKIDGKTNNSQVMTAWESSHLIINYASFRQRGVSKCSVGDLFLDCQPPCDYKAVRFSNGSSYCEIAYPSKTREKFFVSLQANNLLQTASISSTTNLPYKSQARSTAIFPVVTTALVSVLVCCALAGAAVAAIIILRRKKCQRRNKTKNVEIPLDRCVYSNRGRYAISRPGIVINMGDGNTVTVNTTYDNQQGSVAMQGENSPLLGAFSIMDLSRTPENVSVRGLAVLGEHLFFAYRGSSKVRVYSANTLGYKSSWELNELTRPQDVTACSEKNCLYISNIKPTDSDCEILKVSPQGTLINKWETGKNYFGRLSVTHDANVVLAVHTNRRLIEYTTDGTRFREIQLPEFLRPIYALKVSPEYYFVSHGFDEDLEHGVSKVDANGQVLERFGNTKGSTNQQLYNPVQLVLNDESIWVADSQNGRVVVLSPTLEYQATLLSKEEDELSCPLRICIDHNNRRLLLSDLQNQNHFLRVFNFI